MDDMTAVEIHKKLEGGIQNAGNAIDMRSYLNNIYWICYLKIMLKSFILIQTIGEIKRERRRSES